MTYHIVSITETGFKSIDQGLSYSEADELIDELYEVLPHAWLEIVSEEDYRACAA